MKRNKWMILLMALLFLFLCEEVKPATIASSTIYTTANQTEVKMYVIANTLLPINQEKIIEHIISEHRKINGKRENENYIAVLYRTRFHYRKNLEYTTLFCDSNGEIINEGL